MPTNPVDSAPYYSKLRHCAIFLGKFTAVFTLNYDLLTYWSIVYRQKVGNKRHRFGFESLKKAPPSCWRSHLQRSVHFLHGNLNFFMSGSDLFRLSRNTGGGRFGLLKPQIASRLSEQMPLYVCENEGKDKYEVIQSSPYLKDCLNCLTKTSGSLLIFGASLGIQDSHIVEAIANSKITLIGLSVCPKEDYRSKIDKLSKETGKQVIAIDRSVIPVWTR